MRHIWGKGFLNWDLTSADIDKNVTFSWTCLKFDILIRIAIFTIFEKTKTKTNKQTKNKQKTKQKTKQNEKQNNNNNNSKSPYSFNGRGISSFPRNLLSFESSCESGSSGEVVAFHHLHV